MSSASFFSLFCDDPRRSVWMRVTPARYGRRPGRPLARVAAWREEEDAAAKLTAPGARFCTLQPENHRVTIDCDDKTLGDEGYRLVGKCFRLEAANFNRCDLNDDRMRHLAGLRHLTSLATPDTPEVTMRESRISLRSGDWSACS